MPGGCPQLAHSFRTGTGRYDPFGKPSANDRSLRIPAEEKSDCRRRATPPLPVAVWRVLRRAPLPEVEF
jgi:hypothetical protein